MTAGEKKKGRHDRLGPLARKAAQVEHQRALENFNRFNENFVEAYEAERNVARLPEKEKEASL